MKYPTASLVLMFLVFVGCGPGGNDREAPSGTPENRAASVANSPASLNDTDATTPTVWIMPEPPQNYNARQGRALFSHFCATCHGEEGHGDGFNAYSLDPKPRNLADPAFQAERSDDDLEAVIRSGGGVSGLSTAMPPWGRTLNERDIRNIVKYLRVLPPSTE